MILTLRTDKPEAEIGLYEGSRQVAYETWLAHRQLAETLHLKVKTLLQEHDANWSSITGIVVFQGPGSFTGLRIGLTVANALAMGLSIPIAGGRDEDWIAHGLTKLSANQTEYPVMPEYGAEVHITAQKK